MGYVQKYLLFWTLQIFQILQESFENDERVRDNVGNSFMTIQSHKTSYLIDERIEITVQCALYRAKPKVRQSGQSEKFKPAVIEVEPINR